MDADAIKRSIFFSDSGSYLAVLARLWNVLVEEFGSYFQGVLEIFLLPSLENLLSDQIFAELRY